MRSQVEGHTDLVVQHLWCPNCRQPLAITQRRLHCPHGHSFDLSRQGYVDLSAGHVTHSGDSVDMVAARAQLATAGRLDLITQALIGVVPQGQEGLAVDIGCGTGHHLAGLLEARPRLRGLGVDVSKAALRRAARAHTRAMAVRADIWRGLPIPDGRAQLVLDVFAPRSGAEFHRVLRPDGKLVVVTPNPNHLAELVGALNLLAVDPQKEDRLSGGLAKWFTPGERNSAESRLRLTRAEVGALVRMGPSAWHIDQKTLDDRLARLTEPCEATLSIQVSTWQPR